MAIKYKWLAGRLKELIIYNIENGISKLPTEQELCKKYRVSRQTVRQALLILEQDHLIEKRKGSGSYITGLSADSSANTVAILVSSDSDYIYPDLLADIRRGLTASGFSSTIYVTENRQDTERDILLQLQKEIPRALIVECCKSALPNPNLDLYRKLERNGCMIIFMHNYYSEFEHPLFVKDANFEGSALLVHHLAAQDHTQIAGIFKSDDQQGLERFQGFTETMRDLGLHVSDDRVHWYNSYDLNQILHNPDSDFIKKIVQDSLESCTAVICYNDIFAYFLIKELKHNGYHLPEDLAIATFDNSYLSRLDTMSLTTLSHKAHSTGNTVVQTLIDRLKGLPVTSTELPWTLVIGDSTQSHRQL